jgi:hypothetical protein
VGIFGTGAYTPQVPDRRAGGGPTRRHRDRRGWAVAGWRPMGPTPKALDFQRSIRSRPSDFLSVGRATSVPFTPVMTGPERTPTDNTTALDLRRAPSSQVTTAPDLALGAGGSRPIGLLIVANRCRRAARWWRNRRHPGAILSHEPSAIAAPLPALVLPARGARDAGRCAGRASSPPLPTRRGGPLRRAL